MRVLSHSILAASRLVLLLALCAALTACDDETSGPTDVSLDGDATNDVAIGDGRDATNLPDQQVLDTLDTLEPPYDTKDPTDTAPFDTADGQGSDVTIPAGPLVLDAVDPASGPTTGENVVRVLGSGLTPSSAVYFGPTRSPAVEWVDATELSVVVPGGRGGAVDVKVANENGVEVLIGGYTYVDAVLVTSLEPTRSPTTGGVPFTITGGGFTPNTSVSMGGRTAIDIVTVSDTVLTGITPPGVAGLRDLRVTSAAGSLLQPNAITYYVATSLTSVFPAAGPSAGGTEVTLTGTGFDSGTTVLIGAKNAAILGGTPTTLTILTPAQTAGPRNVVVSSASGSATRVNGFTYFTPTGATRLFSIAPSAGSSAGGEAVVIAGEDLDAAPVSALLGGAAINVTAVSATSIAGTTPPGSIGPATVSVTTARGASALVDGYTYVPELRIDSASPATGPVAGGTVVRIAGTGFDTTTRIYFGPLPAAQTTLVSPTQLDATTPVGPGGAVDVQVRNGARAATLPDGFVYTEALAVYALNPNRGSQAGGTQVTMSGSGFAAGAQVTIDGVAAASVDVLDANTLRFITPPHAPEVVDVQVVLDGVSAASPDTFTYYDPSTIYGGGWGAPIDGNLNITVLERQSGAPVEGAFVILNLDPATPFQGLTDVNGQITFAGPTLSSTQTITASKDTYSSTTITTIDAENVTVLIRYLDGESGELPPSKGPGFISGNIAGAEKVSLDIGMDEVRLSLVMTTQVDAYTPNPDPGVDSQVMGNGFYQLQSRLGDVAVIGICGIYNVNTEAFRPKFMAMKRFLFVTEGSTHQVDLNCTIALDLTATVKIVNAPVGEGPDLNLVMPYLNVGPEGVVGGYTMGESTNDTVYVTGLAPLTGALSQMDYYLLGGSFTSGYSPYSVAHRDHVADFSQPIEFGPMLGIPQLVSPQPGGLVQNRHIEWTMSTPQLVDFTIVSLLDPSQFPPMPFWEVYLPGGATSVDLPALLASSGAALPYQGLAFIEFDVIHANRPFDFDKFSLRDVFLDRRETWVYASEMVLIP